MKVTISKAADMVGVTRATLYRHIDKKGISVEKDDDGNPKIDVAELIRVYGDRVRQTDDQQPDNDNDTQTGSQTSQHYTAQNVQGRGPVQQRFDLQRGAQDTRVELEILRERMRHMESDQARSSEERAREREQLTEQIEALRQSLEESQEQQKRLTMLITDQREGQGGEKAGQEETIQNMKKMIAALRQQNKTILGRLEHEEAKKSNGFWQRLFG